MVNVNSTLEENNAKKRQRALQKFGVGGFLVRLRGRFKDEDIDGFTEGAGTEVDKPKKRPPRRKIKNKLVESFPSYLQVSSASNSSLSRSNIHDGDD